MGREGSLFRTMILFLVLLLSNTLFTTVTGDYPTDILTSNTHNQGYSPITTVTPDPITTVWPTDCHQFQEDKVCVIHSVLDVVDELLGTDGKSCQAECQNNPHCQFFTWVVLGEEDNRCYLLYTCDSKTVLTPAPLPLLVPSTLMWRKLAAPSSETMFVTRLL